MRNPIRSILRYLKRLISPSGCPSSIVVDGRLGRLSAWPVFFVVLFASNASAAPPAAFDGWSVAGNGDISAPCPAGFVCQPSVSDAGILQRTMIAPDGSEYIQLILSEQDNTGGNLTNESFVKMATPSGGISAKQTYVQPDPARGTNILRSQAIFNTGWANQAGTPAVQINQALDTWYNNDTVHYEGYFGVLVDQDANGNRLGSYADVWQRVTGSTNTAGSTTTTTGTDVQTFVTRRASGSRVPSAGSIVLPAVNLNGGMMAGGDGGGGMMGGGAFGTGMIGNGAGGTIAWQTGEDVQMTWIGQQCDGCANQGGMGGGGGGGGMGGGGMGGGPGDTLFAYQTVDNLVDALPPIATASLNVTPSPFDWSDPPFGAQPSLNMAAPTF